jgi:hypothetical protein
LEAGTAEERPAPPQTNGTNCLFKDPGRNNAAVFRFYFEGVSATATGAAGAVFKCLVFLRSIRFTINSVFGFLGPFFLVIRVLRGLLWKSECQSIGNYS